MEIRLIKIDKMVMDANVLTHTARHTFCVLLIIQLIFPKANVCFIFGKTTESFTTVCSRENILLAFNTLYTTMLVENEIA